VTSDSKRIIQLDILRAIAILLVLFRHAPFKPSEAGKLQPLAQSSAVFGWTGVDLFFVLSGFLIGGLLFRELKEHGKLDVKRFLVRRAFRIWPTYFIYIGFSIVFIRFVTSAGLFGPLPQDDLTGRELIRGILPNLFHLQNYLGSPRIHTWSIAVEEHFYLALPFFLVCLARRPNGLRFVPAVAVGLMVMCTGLRAYTAMVHPDYQGLVARYPTHLQIDALMFGVAVAYVYHIQPELMERIAAFRRPLFVIGLALVSPMIILPLNDEARFVRILGHPLLTLGYACILISVIHTPIGGVWRRPMLWLTPVGVYSYSIYIWHHDLARIPMWWVQRLGFGEGWPASVRWSIGMAIYLALAYGTAVVLSKLIEKPALALRDRLFPGRAAPLAAASEQARCSQ
jgi:peptidoglycan/LPS O-acetylase OafA/YrhL